MNRHSCLKPLKSDRIRDLAKQAYLWNKDAYVWVKLILFLVRVTFFVFSQSAIDRDWSWTTKVVDGGLGHFESLYADQTWVLVGYRVMINQRLDRDTIGRITNGGIGARHVTLTIPSNDISHDVSVRLYWWRAGTSSYVYGGIGWTFLWLEIP